MDSDLPSNNENSLTIPEDLVLDERVDNWYTKEGVYGANALYCKAKKGGVSTQIERAKRFFEQVKDGYHEFEFGPLPKVRKLESDLQMTEQRITRLSNYLGLDDQDMPVQELPPDLGDERLNQLVSFLSFNFRSINEKFDDVNRRFDALDRSVNSLTARFDNKFKEKGGEDNTAQAYGSVVNRSNQYPNENGLNKITSLNQINRFTSHQITRYLEFYGLSMDGTLNEKRLRLIEFLGINIEAKTNTSIIKVPGAKV